MVSKTRDLADGFGRHNLVCSAGSTREREFQERVYAVGVVASGLTNRFDVVHFKEVRFYVHNGVRFETHMVLISGLPEARATDRVQ